MKKITVPELDSNGKFTHPAILEQISGSGVLGIASGPGRPDAPSTLERPIPEGTVVFLSTDVRDGVSVWATMGEWGGFYPLAGSVFGNWGRSGTTVINTDNEDWNINGEGQVEEFPGDTWDGYQIKAIGGDSVLTGGTTVFPGEPMQLGDPTFPHPYVFVPIGDPTIRDNIGNIYATPVDLNWETGERIWAKEWSEEIDGSWQVLGVSFEIPEGTRSVDLTTETSLPYWPGLSEEDTPR